MATSLSTAGPPSNTWFLGPIQTHNPNGISIGSTVFAQMTAECPYTLQWGALFPFKIAPSHVGIWTPSNTWFLGPTQVPKPNGNSIGAATFAGLTSVTDQQTDHATRSVRIGRIYIRSTAMRPNNNNNLGSITRLCQAVSLQRRHISTIGKKNLLNSNIFSTYTHNMANVGPLTAEIGSRVWGKPANFNRFRVLPSLRQWHRSPVVNQTLHNVWPSPGLVHCIYIFAGYCPLMEFY